MYKMATEESLTTGTEEDQEKMSPSQEVSVLKDTPHNSSELSLNQFGISVKSFIPSPSSSSSSSKYIDKSRLAKLKARRRSSVGVRGSPETNSLIRFIAQQKIKTPTNPRTPEIVRSSPFFPHVASTLRQKMASFQSLVDVVERDACDPEPVKDSNTGGCIMTRDYLSDGICCSVGKENNPPATPTPSKKRRLGPLEGCSVEIREADTFLPHFSLKEQEEAVCERQSPDQPPSGDPAAASSSQQSSLQEIKPTGTDDSNGMSVVKIKKQVHFGAPLSPEFFDKKLPPSTPLQKGGTPVRAPTPGRCLQLRSVLKTPQRSESNTPQREPELDNPSEFGASPTFVIPWKRRLSKGEEGEDGKIGFPSLEESDCALTSDTGCVLDAPMLNLDMAFHEEASSQDLTDCETKASQSSQVDECPSAPADRQTASAPSKRRTKTSQKPKASSSSRERELPEEGEPVRRSVRSAAKSACRKMKMSSSATCFWNKDVDRSLYSSRKYASKKPTLSPIKEKLSLSSQSAALPQPTESCTASNQEPLPSAEIVNDTRAQEDLAVTEPIENTLLDSVTSPGSGKGNSQPSRSTVRRGGRKRKVASSDCEQPQNQEEEKSEHLPEDPFSSSFRFSEGTPSKRCEFHEESDATKEPGAQLSLDPPCWDTGTSEHHVSLQVSSPCCPPSAEDSSNTESQQAKRGSRRRAKECRTSSGVDEAGITEQADSQHRSSQERQGGANEILFFWQADFNFEDVFKPAARRGQSSVRRSLRNQRSSEHGCVGHVWLPYTPSVRQTHRVNRRRVSGTVPMQPPLPEDMQDATLSQLMVDGDN